MTLPRLTLLLALLAVARVATAAPDEAIISRIKREPVLSSNVASVGYSKRLHALEIEFTRGATYRFFGVPREVYRELMETSSKGHFINENIRGHFRFVRVRLVRSPRARATMTAHR